MSSCFSFLIVTCIYIALLVQVLYYVHQVLVDDILVSSKILLHFRTKVLLIAIANPEGQIRAASPVYQS